MCRHVLNQCSFCIPLFVFVVYVIVHVVVYVVAILLKTVNYKAANLECFGYDEAANPVDVGRNGGGNSTAVIWEYLNNDEKGI